MSVILKSKQQKDSLLELRHFFFFLGEQDRNAVYVVYAS